MDRLPELSERGHRWFGWLWLLLFLLALVALSAGGSKIYFRTANSPFNHAGLGWFVKDGTVRVQPVPGSPAEQAGIRAGDWIVAIDSRKVGRTLEDVPAIDQLLAGPEGSRVLLTVAREDGRTASYGLERTRANAELLLRGSGITWQITTATKLVSLLVPQFFFLLVSLLLMRGKRSSPRALLSLTFLLLVLGDVAAAAWFGNATWIPRIFSILSASLLVVSLVSFPDGVVRSRTARWIAALSLPVAALSITQSQDHPELSLLLLGLLLGALAMLLQRYRNEPAGDVRQQVRWTLLGFALGLFFLSIVILMSFVVRPVWADPRPVDVWYFVLNDVFSAIALICWALGVLVAMLKYRLYDVDRLISRSAAFGLTSVAFLASFAGAQQLLEKLGESYFEGQMGIYASGIGAAIATAAIIPLHGRVIRWVERHFNAPIEEIRSKVPRLARVLQDSEAPEALAVTVADRLSRCLKGSEVAILFEGRILAAAACPLEDAQRWLELHGEPGGETCSLEPEDALFPVRVPMIRPHTEDLTGWILVGDRPDGSLPGKDERAALIAAADDLAQALLVADHRVKREERLFEQVEQRLAALEARLANVPQGAGASA